MDFLAHVIMPILLPLWGGFLTFKIFQNSDEIKKLRKFVALLDDELAKVKPEK